MKKNTIDALLSGNFNPSQKSGFWSKTWNFVRKPGVWMSTVLVTGGLCLYLGTENSENIKGAYDDARYKVGEVLTPDYGSINENIADRISINKNEGSIGVMLGGMDDICRTLESSGYVSCKVTDDLGVDSGSNPLKMLQNLLNQYGKQQR